MKHLKTLLTVVFALTFSLSAQEVQKQMPSPIGGINSIQKRVHYPELAKRAGIEGRVIVKASVDNNGNVTKTKIVKGLDGGCSEEVLAVIKSTKFEKGREGEVLIPILFKLDSKKEKTKKK